MIVLEGFDDALMGKVRRFNCEFAVYDYQKVISILSCDMSRPEAEEYFEYNIVGGWLGDETPGFFYLNEGDVIEP